MQPTVSPWAWVSSWERRARTRLAPRVRDHDKYTFYGLRKDGRHFIRLDPLAKGLLLNRQWAGTSAPVTWRVDRFHDTEPWAAPDIKSIQSYRPYEPVSLVLPGGAGGPVGPVGPAGSSRPVSHGWSYGARGWAAGAIVLALLVLLVRAAENCLHKKLFKAIYMHTIRRQESDEWSTPNVMATSLQLNHADFDVGSLSGADDIEASPPPADMPPPYSACDVSKCASEEPPPPYSACYVTYCPEGAGPHVSTNIDNVRNDLIENGLRAECTGAVHSEDVDPDTRTEFVFDNGRIVERLNLDLNLNSNNNETGVVSNGNEEEQRTGHAEIKDRVVYIDETASESTTPDRALLV